MIFGRMNRHTPVKVKKSFTLSHSSAVFLERLRQERRVASTSSILDELIRDAEAHHRRSLTEQAISTYYSTLSPDEENEQRIWGEFAGKQLSEEPGKG
jgi:hypothetical protein